MGSHRRAAGARPYVEMISGVKLYRDNAGRVTVAFCDEDRNHPDLIRRSRELNARGEARGVLDWASLTGKDARLWQAFRPLEHRRVQLAQLLHEALVSPASGFELDPIQALDAAEFSYWWQPEEVPSEPAALGLEAMSELFQVELRVQIGRQALVYVRTFDEGEWDTFSSDVYPDELIRCVDFGTAEARARHIQDFYLIAVTPDRDPSQPYAMRLQEYRDHPDLLRLALAHRSELGLEDFAVLAGHIGWLSWVEVEARGR